MFDHCRLKDFAPGEGVALGAFAGQFDTDDWIDVAVPGDVHQALAAAGRIPDPFYDRNELDCAWVEEREWWYRAQFTYEHGSPQPQERLLLVFHGLDTFVTIWLNGEQLGKHGNMFREAIFDVTRSVYTDRPNTLALCFDPPLDHVRDTPSLSWRPGELIETKRNFMRKAQFGFGWDWGPRLPTVGIWRPVEIRRQHQAAIQGVHFATLEIDPAGERALVWARVEVERFAGDRPIEVALALIPPDGTEAVAEQTLVPTDRGGRLVAEASMPVEQPSLWWTHDLGEPCLYTLQVRILQDGSELDRKQQVGIRTLELDQSPDPEEPGTRFFRFVLNGIPIFARGANWIPASSFVGALTADRYEQLLTAALDANMNMLRVWGGGIYEHDAFYDLCDRLGILIWQDFMFACAPYPEDDPGFVDEVRAEVRYQVECLRNHPSLALWCGNNENQMLHHYMKVLGQEQPAPLPGTLYYDEIMPKVVQDLDRFTPYWPGSPYGGPQPNSMAEGDVHDWHVWHGFPVSVTDREDLAEILSSGPKPEDVSFIHYAENTGRFISEFGMHASPVHETLRRCMPSDQLYHHSPTMDHHNKDNPKTKGDNLMLTVTGLPRDLDEYIDFSMIAQAEGLKFGIEHFRRRKPHCSGTLLWQLNDCWPGLSWSILDYYGFGKAGYFYVKRAYAPVLASFKALDDGTSELWITNDTLEDVSDTIVIKLGTFAEGTVWEERHQVQAPANSSRVVWRGEAQQIVARPDHYLAVRSSSERFPANRHFFAPVKDLQRPVVEPEIALSSRGEHELLVHVHAPAYLYYFHVIVSDERTHFSDNYFDLAAGESRTVVATNQETPLTPDMVSTGWR